VKPTSIRDLLAILVVLGVIGYLMTTLVYGVLPPLPAPAGITLLVLAALEVILAFALKARIDGKPGTRPVDPLVAARAVALAKASAVAGAVLAGLWAGFTVFVLARHTEIAAAADDVPGAVIGLVSALALTGAALWLEHCCRTPIDSDSDPDDRRRDR
jgi:hypothetical protein